MEGGGGIHEFVKIGEGNRRKLNLVTGLNNNPPHSRPLPNPLDEPTDQ